nr:MAG TPA: ribonuclease Y [Caudoviricetes sp.]
MAKEEKNTPVVGANGNSPEIDNASTESNNTQAQALNEREAALNKREETLNEREKALNEVEKQLNAREQQLDQYEAQLKGTPEKPTEKAPRKGHEFTFRNVSYKFADDAPQMLLIGGEALSQEEIANDEELLLQLIGGQSPLINKLTN